MTQRERQRHTTSTIAEYGTSQHAVSVRLVGVTEQDTQLQLDRMVLCFGALFVATAPKQSGHGREWIAYGTIVG